MYTLQIYTCLVFKCNLSNLQPHLKYEQYLNGKIILEYHEIDYIFNVVWQFIKNIRAFLL